MSLVKAVSLAAGHRKHFLTISLQRALTQQPLQQCWEDLLPAIYSLLFGEQPVLSHTHTFCHSGIWHMIRVCLDTRQSVMELSLLDRVLESSPGIVRVIFDFSMYGYHPSLIQPDTIRVCENARMPAQIADDPESSSQGDEGLNLPFFFPCPASCSYSTPFLSLSTAPCTPQYLSDQ